MSNWGLTRGSQGELGIVIQSRRPRTGERGFPGVAAASQYHVRKM